MSRPVQGGASYRAVLVLPHARGLALAGALARLPYGLISLPLLLALREAVGSYGAAGTSVGVYGLLSAVLGPWRARLAERRPGALQLLAVGFAAVLALIAALALLAAGGARGPVTEAVAPVLAVVAGILPPPVGPLLRARWGVLAGGEAQRQAALSLDAVAESTVFSVGPLLGGALIAVTTPGIALAVVAAIVVLGFSSLAPVLARTAAPAPTRSDAARLGADGIGADRTGAGRRSPLRSAGFLVLLGAVAAVGAAGAMAELAAVAGWGAAVAGPLLAGFSVGGVVGGLVYGRLSWRRSPRTRMAVLGAVGGVVYLLPLLWFAPAGALPTLLVAGAVTDATLITAYLLVDTAESSAWINTAFNLGVALGTSAAGMLISRDGPRVVFAVAALVPLLACAVCAASALTGARRVEPLAAQEQEMTDRHIDVASADLG
ncbi:MFS transporter [Streptacidiphilus sp. MAP5-3]|uniref:MFS transporter n=1 Tax=unclassified Streptacidiphilus TaxID=2643834 RepID=UPI00351518B6